MLLIMRISACLLIMREKLLHTTLFLTTPPLPLISYKTLGCTIFVLMCHLERKNNSPSLYNMHGHSCCVLVWPHRTKLRCPQRMNRTKQPQCMVDSNLSTKMSKLPDYTEIRHHRTVTERGGTMGQPQERSAKPIRRAAKAV